MLSKLVKIFNQRSESVNKVTKSASKIIGVDVDNVKSINEAALLSKLKTIELDNTHPLHNFFF